MPPAPIVIGMVLRIETRGWQGPPPKLALEPMRVEAGRSPLDQIAYFDLSPPEDGQSVEAACARVGSRLEKLLLSAEAVGQENFFAARCRLEVGLWVDRGQAPYSYVWPAEFLQILAGGDVELAVSHYVAEPEEAEQQETSTGTE